MSHRVARYGMILLEPVPRLLRARGAPVVFGSPEETVEYARLHGVLRWMVCGREDGWWPIYTQAGPLHDPPPVPGRVDITLRR
jgi:hypothetical protein